MNKKLQTYILPSIIGREWGGVFCLLGVLCILCVSSCKDEETYAEQKEKERKAVSAFVSRDPLVLIGRDDEILLSTGKINAISPEQFEAQDSTTDVSKNEYVLFGNTGIYMQIVRKGAGHKLSHGETKRVVCRYFEWNIMGDSLQSTNQTFYWATTPDVMDVSNNSGTISASFNTSINGGGAMYRLYGAASKNTAVPTGWVVPLSYVNLGRQSSEGVALVRLIVPHSSGQPDATNNVYPCFYEISYEEMRD